CGSVSDFARAWYEMPADTRVVTSVRMVLSPLVPSMSPGTKSPLRSGVKPEIMVSPAAGDVGATAGRSPQALAPSEKSSIVSPFCIGGACHGARLVRFNDRFVGLIVIACASGRPPRQ